MSPVAYSSLFATNLSPPNPSAARIIFLEYTCQIFTLSKLLMTSCFLQDKVKTPFHGTQMVPSISSLILWPTLQLPSAPQNTQSSKPFPCSQTVFLLFPLTLSYKISLMVMVKYPLFLSSLEQTSPPRQANSSWLCPSVTWHVSLLTGCGRFGELHLWLAKGMYTTLTQKECTILLIHFFKGKKCLWIAFTVCLKNTATTNLRLSRRTEGWISEHVVSYCPLFGMDREHT